MRKYYFTFILALSFNGCLDRIESREIKIINNSEKAIYCLISKTNILQDPYIDYDYMILTSLFKIKNDSFGYIPDKPRNWNSYINNCDGKKLRIFIISQDSLDKNGWTKVLRENIYSRVYHLSLEDLNKHNWQIVYEEE